MSTSKTWLLFRRLFVAAFLLYHLAWLTHGSEWLSTTGFFITAAINHRDQISPFARLPPAFVPLLGLLLIAGALLAILCNKAKWPLLACLLIAVYVDNTDQISSFSLNKIYIVILFLLLLREMTSQTASGQAMDIALSHGILLTPLAIYFAAGICKLRHGTWLHEPDVLWGQVQGIYRTDLCGWAISKLPFECWSLAQSYGLFFELCAPLLLLLPKLRPVGIASGFIFHIGVALLMERLWFFSLQMLTFYVLFSPSSPILNSWDANLEKLMKMNKPPTDTPGKPAKPKPDRSLLSKTVKLLFVPFSYVWLAVRKFYSSLKLERKADYISVAAFMLSLVSIGFNLYDWWKGPAVTFIPPSAIVIAAVPNDHFSESGILAASYSQDSTNLHIFIDCAYFNTSGKDYPEAVTADGVLKLIIGGESYTYSPHRYVTVTRKGSSSAHLQVDTKSSALPFDVEGGKVQAQTVYFAPFGDKRLLPRDFAALMSTNKSLPYKLELQHKFLFEGVKTSMANGALAETAITIQQNRFTNRGWINLGMTWDKE